jgi:hypothetical protein
VTIHPAAGQWYAAPGNKEISHYIVCKGTTPETPVVASAEVTVTPATCDADGFVVGTTAVNATFGTATYLDGQYTIVATATGSATFPAGAGVSPDGTTKTFTGVYETKLTGEQCEPDCEPATFGLTSVVEDFCLATAVVSFGTPTCFAPGALVLGATEHASFGLPTINGEQYTVVATAEAGYHFAAGVGVSDDGSTKTFSGNLPAKLTGPECDLPDLDIVEPTISFTQPTCFANGTYTVGGADVQWSRGGVEIPNGQYSLASGVEIELTVAPKEPHGFAPEQQTSWTVEFAAASGPCDLTTLSLPNTGGGIAGGALWLGLMTLGLGAAAVVVASRRAAAKQ